MLAIAIAAAGEMSYELNVATPVRSTFGIWSHGTMNTLYPLFYYGIHMNYLVHSTFHLACTQFLISLSLYRHD